MIKSKNDANRNLEKALQALEQAKQRVANEKKKQNEKKCRPALWNAVELSEEGQKSQLARMLKASLPNEWGYELAEEVVRDYVQRNFVDKGMCADWAIHDKRRLDLPIVSGKHLRRISDRTALQSADNAEKFITARKIDSFESLAKFTEDREQSKTDTELAYAEVISYNRKNLEREFQNESRQHSKQQSKTKRREEEI